MSDTADMAPLTSPKITELALLARLQKLREWQDQQVEELRSAQRQQWQQLQQEQEKVRQLLGKKKDENQTDLKNNYQQFSSNAKPTLQPLTEKSIANKYANEKATCDELQEIKVSSAESDGTVSEEDGIYPLSGTTSEEEQTNSEPHTHPAQERLTSNHLEDDRPIQPGIAGGVKSFEDMLKEHLTQHRKVAIFNEDSTDMKSKKPFLRKGAGLARFNIQIPKVPNYNAKSTNGTKPARKEIYRKPAYAIPVLKLHPQKNPELEVNKKCDKSELEAIGPSDNAFQNEIPLVEGKITLSENVKQLKGIEDKIPSALLDDSSFMKHEELDKNKEKELRELAEFEMLENAAQNSSFTSDSSLFVQAMQNLHLQSSPIIPKNCNKSKIDLERKVSYASTRSGEPTDIYDKESNLPDARLTEALELRRLLETVMSKKKMLEEKIVQFQLPEEHISDVKESTEHLNSSKNDYSDEDTLIDEEDKEKSIALQDVLQKISAKRMPFNVPTHKNIAWSDSEKEVRNGCNSDSFQFNDEFSWTSSIPSPSSSPYGHVKGSVSKNSSSKETDAILLHGNMHSAPQHKDISIQVSFDGCSGTDCGVIDRLELKQKLQELESEIAIFKKENEALKMLQKQREEALQQMLKEKKEFEKYREEEMKRMEQELAEEKRQLKRQKQTFERCQKMKRDFPDKKEREDLASLKHQVQQLQEDMKKQEMRFASEVRRLKCTLTTVEKDRDRLKGEVQHLETIRLELLAALKEKQTARTQPLKVPKKAVASIKKSNEISELPPHNIVKEAEETEGKHLYPSRPVINPNKQGMLENKRDTNSSIYVSDSLDTIETSLCSLHIESEIKNDDEPQPKQKLRVHFNLEPEYEKDSAISTDNEYEELHHKDRIERIYKNGEREIIYPSGTRKHFGPDNSDITVHFYNGDIKEIFPDQRVVYRYAEDGIIQTTYSDGLMVVEFSNGQIERSHPDGTKHISFSDGSHRIIYPDGSEESQVRDGTIMKIAVDGTETVHYSNGETEIRTKEYKRRQYADGTLKTVYTSGRQETRYSNGRIRIKDKDGHVVVDTKYLVQQLQDS